MLANAFITLEDINLFEIDPTSMVNCTNVTHVAELGFIPKKKKMRFPGRSYGTWKHFCSE